MKLRHKKNYLFQNSMKIKEINSVSLMGHRTYPSFCSMKQLEVFLLPLDGMLSVAGHFPAICQVSPTICLYPFIHLGGERHCESKVCLAQEHNTMSQASARTRTAYSRVERTNHEATAPPIKIHDQIKTSKLQFLLTSWQWF